MRLLLTGDYGRPEFSSAVAEMRGACEVVVEPELSQAAHWLAAGASAVDLIVVAAGRPGQFSSEQIESLRRAAPLAPVVALVGTWCEGEPRSGAPWPGVVRIYWHQWSTRFPQEMACLNRGETSAWNQPPTATPEERLLSMPAAAGKTSESLIALVSESFEAAEWLSATCRGSGMETIVFRRRPDTAVEGAAVVLWDAGLARSTLAEDFRQLAACFPGVPVIVLLDFPRSSDLRQLTDVGAAVVLAKPVLTVDLRWAIARVVRPHARSKAAMVASPPAAGEKL